jgi:signal transduction histidine kinase
MKQIFVFLLLLISLQSGAQEVFQLQSPDGSLVALQENWVYRMGDTPDARQPFFNDQGWKAIRPAADIHDSLPDDAKTGIGWMRLRFRVSAKTDRLQLALLVHQMIASEIYLNGQLIRKYGIISADPEKIRAHDPRWEPVQLTLSPDTIQVLAIRFAVQPGIRYTIYFGSSSPFMSIGIMDYVRAINKYKEIYQRPWMDLFMQGIIFMVFILHMAFFLMYPVQKANLLFSLAALCNLTGSMMHNFYYYGASPGQKFLFANLASAAYGISQLLMIASVYRYLKIRTSGLLWLFAGVLVCSLVAGAVWYEKGFKLFLGWMPIISYLMIMAISWYAWKNRVRESLILMIGFGIAIIAFFLFLGGFFIGNLPGDHVLRPFLETGALFFLFYVVGPPAAVSIFLAYDFANTSKKLGAKLAEVEMLSAKNLSVEREKQDILAAQNQELENRVRERTSALNASLQELKAAQAQLVQAEKMASLGELTAGIAHEIQNPLNFVNNFSEINKELLTELKEEISKGNYTDALEFADDVLANQEKINFHGKRADAIVKSMLQHSRGGLGRKELTYLNKLVDEYARLAYHGFRSRHEHFQTDLVCNLDEAVGEIPLNAQDIGRVLLNLLNNAFYAVKDKTNIAGEGYLPVVKITTRRLSTQDLPGTVPRNQPTVEITVSDNGTGIPEQIREKIFQPFFTTRTTGQGTGLGLSLSYDIIKAHGGELRVVSTNGQGAEFIIILPTEA